MKTKVKTREAKGRARLEEARRRELEREYQKDRETSRRDERDQYGRIRWRVVVSGIELPLLTLLFCGFLLGFGATFGGLFARYLLSLVTQLR